MVPRLGELRDANVQLRSGGDALSRLEKELQSLGGEKIELLRSNKARHCQPIMILRRLWGSEERRGEGPCLELFSRLDLRCASPHQRSFACACFQSASTA